MQMDTQPLRELPTLITLFFAQTATKPVVRFPWLWQFMQWLCDHWHVAAVSG
jgi:hypothetical protein